MLGRAGLATLMTFGVLAAPAAAIASDVVVQGTTDVRDAGLLDEVIVPGFQARYPEYTLKYIAVGTGQALTNARAGQGDAVLTHAPTLEAQFVQDGYSYEPFGRAIFYSDYVVTGYSADPAGVASAAPHDAAHAFELIAQAGEAGHANFVSRGDNSGTNVEEKQIWALTNVPLNSRGEPGAPGTTGNAPWYHKAGAGQAQTVQVADQCPFSGGNCYEITDRGTFNRLTTNGAVTNLEIVADKNDAGARGGLNLLLNSFHAYAVNPAKNPGANVQGALAFLSYLTSPQLQKRLAGYPNTQTPAFFADALPAFKLTSAALPRRVTAGQKVKVAGTLTPALPGATPLSGIETLLVDPLFAFEPGAKPLATARLSANAFSFTASPTHSGDISVVFPGYQDLSLGVFPVGKVRVRAKVTLQKVRVAGGRAKLSGRVLPKGDHKQGRLRVLGRRSSGNRYRTLATRPVGAHGSRFAETVKLRSGRWQLRAEFSDPGRLDSGLSRVVRISVP